ncbi:MAG: hypothetical protein IT518_19790 [Burkholderiales bacterium]|nr:hypothetical protein [Burkholderiales bacterium]
MSDGYAAFCTGYRNGAEACRPRPLERKEVTDACLAGATLHSQSRIRDYAVGPSAATASRSAAPAARPGPDVCRRTMVDEIGLAGADEVRQAIAPRFPDLVVGTVPESWNLRLEARGSACDDPRVTQVLYDFDAKGVLHEVTFVWSRPAGAAPSPLFKERAAALARRYGLPPPQSPSRLEATTKTAHVVLEDAAGRNAVLEIYGLPR